MLRVVAPRSFFCIFEKITVMIKASELRIGNIILYLNELYVVDGIKYEPNAPSSKWRIGFRMVDDNNQAARILRNAKMENWIEPVPLEPEILEKCGFIQGNDLTDRNVFYATGRHKGIASVTVSGGIMISGAGKSMVLDAHIEYLHQLQNLYFALTGDELVVNLQQPATA